MAWSDAPGAQRDLPPNWKSLRKAVKARAGGRCEKRLPSGKRCPRKGTDADHIGSPDLHTKGNLRWLCDHHHKQRTAAQAKAARERGGTVLRDPGKHPGSLR